MALTYGEVRRWLAGRAQSPEALLRSYQAKDRRAVGMEFSSLDANGAPEVTLLYAHDEDLLAELVVDWGGAPHPVRRLVIGELRLRPRGPDDLPGGADELPGAAGAVALTDRNARFNPVVGGVSFGAEHGYSGALACAAADPGTPDAPKYLLSCEHVLYEVENPASNPQAVQPSDASGQPAGPRRVGGVVRRGCRPAPGEAFRVDAAIAEFAAPDRTASWGVEGVGRVSAWWPADEVPVGLEVVKSGPILPYVRNGEVQAVGVFITLDWYDRSVLFGPLYRTTRVGTHGDSGSLITDEHAAAVGLLMAVSSLAAVNAGIVCPIETVQKQLDVVVAPGRRHPP